MLFCFSGASFHPISSRFYTVYVSRYVSKIIMLTTSVEAICFNYRPKKDSTYPIMLRLTKSGKRKYVSLEVSVKEEDWDFSKNTPKRKCPDRDLILSIIEKRTAAYRTQINEYRMENKDYTLETLENYFTLAMISFSSAATSLSCIYSGLYFPRGISLRIK